MSKIIVIDTETTGLNPMSDEILQLSVVAFDGEVLYNKYFKPEYVTEWKDAERVNHITPEMVAFAPTISSELAEIFRLLHTADIIAGYNVTFDLRFLCELGYMPHEGQKVHDVMLEFAPVYGQLNAKGTYNKGKYKWQKLSTCAAFYGYKWTESEQHNSLDDCMATLYCYKKLRGYHD